MADTGNGNKQEPEDENWLQLILEGLGANHKVLDHRTHPSLKLNELADNMDRLTQNTTALAGRVDKLVGAIDRLIRAIPVENLPKSPFPGHE